MGHFLLAGPSPISPMKAEITTQANSLNPDVPLATTLSNGSGEYTADKKLCPSCERRTRVVAGELREEKYSRLCPWFQN
jgi:hypothetical protein